MSETTPSLIFIGDLSEEDSALFEAWQERCHEVAIDEGIKLCPYADGLPILVGIIREHCQRLSKDEMLRLTELLFEKFHAAWSEEPQQYII